MEQYVKIVPSDSGFIQCFAEELKEIESHLTEDQELNLRINGCLIRIEWIKHKLGLICVFGTDSTGQLVEVVCHEHCFSGVLEILKKQDPEKPPVCIGFLDWQGHQE